MKKAKHSTPNIQHSTLKEGEDAHWEFHDGNVGGRKYDLEERLMEFASAVIDSSEKLPASRAGNHIAGQILRSGTSPYPNHGEAEAAESRDDFVRQWGAQPPRLLFGAPSRQTLRAVGAQNSSRQLPPLCPTRGASDCARGGRAPQSQLHRSGFVLSESDELIRIFFSSIQTARNNALTQKTGRQGPARYPSGTAG